MRKRSRALAGGFAGLIALAAAAVAAIESDAGGEALARYVCAAASSPDMTLEIGAIEGALSSTPAVSKITLSDRNGPWLKIDRIGASWSRLALLGLTLNIERIDIGAVDMLRRPAPSAAPEEKAPATARAAPAFPPSLPIGLRLGELALRKLTLAESVAGSAATLRLHAGGALNSAEARFNLLAERLDAPGSIAADAAYGVGDGGLRLKFAANEPGDGLIARLANLPGLPPVSAAIDGEGTLDAFEATLAASAGEAGAKGKATLAREGAARRLSFDLDATLADILPRDLAALVAGATKIGAAARLADNGAKTLERLSVAASAFDLGAAGEMGADGAATGTLRLKAEDLGRFSRLAGRDLSGALDLAADLSGAPLAGVLEAALDATVTGPRSGVAAVDGLVGEKLRLTGKARAAAGGFAFDRLTLEGRHLTARLDGEAAKQKAALRASIDIPDLRPAGLPLTGRAAVTADLTGGLDKPDAALRATLEDATANGRPIQKLSLAATAQDLAGQLVARATLDGLVDRKPARGAFSLLRAGAGWKLDDLDLAVGGATATGRLALDGAGLADGRLSISAPNLDDLSALALQKLGGRLSADIALEAKDGGQNATINAQGAGIDAAGASVGRLAAAFSARDLLRKPALDGEIAVDNARLGKETINKARLLARPAGAGAAALDLALDARGFNVASRATLTPGEATRLDLASFSVMRGGRKITLAQPATIVARQGAVELKGVALALGSGRLDIDGTVGERLDLTAKARAAPLSIAAIADPSLALDGVLDAEARITGTKTAPVGDWRVKVSKISAPQLRANGLPAIDAAATGRLSGGRTTLDADVALGPSSKLKIAGSAPLGEGGLDLAVKGALDAALANAMLAANGQTVAGKANIDLTLKGPPANPVIGGAAAIANGAFNDPLNGVTLEKINGKLEGHGHELTINGLVAQTKNGGQLAVAGQISVAPDAGMPGSIHIFANNAQLASTDIVSSVGDLDLTIGGALARNPKVSGKVNLDSMEVSVPDRVPANLKPLPGSTHIDAKGFAAQMLALERKQKEKAARKSTFDAALDLALTAPNKIFVRGHGIDAEFGGALKINGTIQKPFVLGGFDLRRGKLQLLTQRLDIKTGKLSFTGGLAPQLDFLAEAKAVDITAKIAVTGQAAAPVFTLSSSPEMPQDEVLSRLLFARASGSLTPFQAVQLAAAVAQLSGAASGVDAFEKMRKALGVDSLDLDANAAGGPTVGASRYITDGVSVGVKTGAKPEQTSVNVGVDITRGVRIQSETGLDGRTSVGIGVEHEY